MIRRFPWCPKVDLWFQVTKRDSRAASQRRRIRHGCHGRDQAHQDLAESQKLDFDDDTAEAGSAGTGERACGAGLGREREEREGGMFFCGWHY